MNIKKNLLLEKVQHQYVWKKEQYAMKEFALFDHKSIQQFLAECEILFKLLYPCIVNVCGFNYGDKTHKPSIVLLLEPKSLETSIKNKELSCEEKNRIVLLVARTGKSTITFRNL